MEKALENNNTEIIDESNKNIKIIENELDIYRDREAKILANRAKTKWYSEGEKSNKYFLNIIKKRQQKKLIDKLEDEKGEYRTNIDDKLDLANDYYEKLYKKTTHKHRSNNIFKRNQHTNTHTGNDKRTK